MPGPRELADRFVDGTLAPAAEAAARRFLFGPDARGTLDQLYAAGASGSSAPPDGVKGFFADPARRAAAGRRFRAVARVLVLPGAALAALWRGLSGRA